jgi:hypothetical protein
MRSADEAAGDPFFGDPWIVMSSRNAWLTA